MKKRRLVPIVMAGLAAAGGVFAQTGDYPVRPVTIVVGFPPGTATDAVARVLAERFAVRLGKSFIVDNRSGQGGSIGAAAAARAAPDGYTLIVSATAPLAINPNLYSKLPYDPVRDFAPIGLHSWLPYALVANLSVPAKNLNELIELAKARPGQISYASTGNGTTSHLLMTMLSQRSGAKFTHVPYRGSGQSLTDVMAGHVDISFDTLVATMPYVKSGRVRALATSGLARAQYAPEIPTAHEQGLTGFEGGAWLGLLAPAGTPRPIVELLNRELNATLAEPETRKRLLNMGSEIMSGTPDEFAAYIRSENVKWGRLVRDSGAHID